METRRGFLKAAAATCMLPTVICGAEGPPASRLLHASGDEDDFVRWYDVDRSIVNLENAYWNVMSRPVLEEYWSQTQFVNRVNVPFVRGVLSSPALPAELLKVRAAVAGLIGAEGDEIAMTRCGTESLQDLITGYRRLLPGDVVIYCDLDYDSMQNAMLFLKERRGVAVATFSIPEPATTANILAAYEEVLKKTPRAKLMLVTHLCHRTGLVMPVKEIVALAQQHGVAVILDTAQALGRCRSMSMISEWTSLDSACTNGWVLLWELGRSTSARLSWKRLRFASEIVKMQPRRWNPGFIREHTISLLH